MNPNEIMAWADVRPRLLKTLQPVCERLCKEGLAGDESSFTAYVDINEFWMEIFGQEILEDKAE